MGREGIRNIFFQTQSQHSSSITQADCWWHLSTQSILLGGVGTKAKWLLPAHRRDDQVRQRA